MSLVGKFVGLDPNVRKPLDIGLVWEGNYWDDRDVHDCCDVDWETCSVLVDKIARALHKHHFPMIEKAAERERVLIFLPRVMQLPLSILAAFRVGHTTILMDPLTTEMSHLEAVVAAEKPRVLITVDAFWQAQTLIDLKRNIERIAQIDDTTQLIVIRHVAPNPGVPPPRKHIPARRPSYRTSLDLRDGKDVEWAQLISEVGRESAETTENEWLDDEVLVVFPVENGKSINVSKSQLLAALETRKTGLAAKFAQVDGAVENVLVLDAPRDLETLTNFLIPWFMGKTMTLYEGPLDYPDSSRLTQIISKHSANCVLGVGSNYSIPNPEYLKFFPTPTLKIAEIPNFPISL